MFSLKTCKVGVLTQIVVGTTFTSTEAAAVVEDAVAAAEIGTPAEDAVVEDAVAAAEIGVGVIGMKTCTSAEAAVVVEDAVAAAENAIATLPLGTKLSDTILAFELVLLLGTGGNILAFKIVLDTGGNILAFELILDTDFKIVLAFKLDLGTGGNILAMAAALAAALAREIKIAFATGSAIFATGIASTR
jgi:hypothetical protein